MKNLADFICRYDTVIIFLFAAINAGVFVYAKLKLKKGNRILYTPVNKRFKIRVDLSTNREDVEKLQDVKNKVLLLYSAYANITAIFPLLGILGTVAALVTYSSETNMMDNLMTALTTTLVGVFFAIISKICDPFISGPIEVFVDDAEYAIREFDKKGELADEA